MITSLYYYLKFGLDNCCKFMNKTHFLWHIFKWIKNREILFSLKVIIITRGVTIVHTIDLSRLLQAQ